MYDPLNPAKSRSEVIAQKPCVHPFQNGLEPSANTADDIEIITRETLRLQRLIDDVFTHRP